MVKEMYRFTIAYGDCVVSDIDDKSILTMNDLELTNSIKPPGDR